MNPLKRYIRWFWRASKGARGRITLCCLLDILRVFLSLYFVYVSKTLVDIATGLSKHDFRLYSLILILCVVTQILLSGTKGYLFGGSDILLKNRLRGRLSMDLLRMDLERQRRYHTGDITSRLGEDVRVIANALTQVLPSSVATVVQFILAFVFLSHLDNRLAWAIVLVLPACLLFSKLFVGTIRRLTLSIRQGESKVQSHIQESYQHLVLLQSLEKESWMLKRLDGLQKSLYGTVLRRNRFSAFSRMMLLFAFSGGYAIAFLWGVKGIYAGTVTFGMMTAFLQLVGQIQRPLADIARQASTLVHATASADRLMELEGKAPQNNPEPIQLKGRLGIRLQDVSFMYPGGSRYILKGFTHDFRPGSRTAILGETGAGKTTLFRLILALLFPQEGRITLYNENEEAIPIAPSIRCHLTYVPQGNSLWSGTIRENLLLGNPKATEKEMKQVLKTAVADFVFELPDGLDTLCGEQGGGLSEGQAQRIAIARALLRKGTVMLFDELSSSLDEKTEEILIRNLVNNLPGHTMLFITHRPHVADYCDQVLPLHRIPS